MSNLYPIVDYVIFSNPISSGAGSLVKKTASIVGDISGIKPKVIEKKMLPPEPLWKLIASSGMGPYVKLAGLSGAAAVILGAYGAHRTFADENLKQVFETANKYHFYHTFAMMGLVFCRMPMLTATLWLSGILMFSGSCYYYALTGDKTYSKVTPWGGTCFIAGWLSMCL